MWLLRIVLGVFYIWSGYWLAYNMSIGERDAAVITFMWIMGVTKIVFCMKEQFPASAVLRPIIVIGLSIFLCPDIFSVFFTLGLMFIAWQVMLVMNAASFLLTGRSWAASTSAISSIIDKTNGRG